MDYFVQQSSFAHSSFSTWWEGVVAKYPPGLIEFTARLMIEVLGYTLSGLYPYLVTSNEQKKAAIRKCVPVVLTNMVVGSGFYASVLRLLSWYHGCSMWERSFTKVTADVPSAWEVVVQLIIGNLIFDVLFYYVHQLLHTPLFYRYVHSIHHSFDLPVGIAVSYVHPVEYVLVVTGALVVALAVQGAHILTTTVWGLYVMFVTSWLHTSSDIYWLANHEGHHLRHNKNLGAVGVMDWIHGTSISASEVDRLGRRFFKSI
jgi:sterol desaturase/sphingolipid hydroxylase (fatty acid hydroxylase superfamily)